jgi:hypothetical protein
MKKVIKNILFWIIAILITSYIMELILEYK